MAYSDYEEIVCDNPYWTVEEGNVGAETLELTYRYETTIVTDQSVVVRAPKDSASIVTIMHGLELVETLEEHVLYRISPSEKQAVTVTVLVHDGLVSVLYVKAQ